ncbi:dTDP-4-dehydrorhamnose reductase [compost metagenome]
MPERRPPRILVVGANGQVGHELMRTTEALGHVTGVARGQLDLADATRIRSCLDQVKPDLVINAAAYTAVDAAEQDEARAMAINADAPGVMAEECRRLGALLVHYSTDYVFDGSKTTSYVEADAPAPLSAYGRSKLAGERAIAQAGCAHVIFRTSWVYGVRGKNFLLTMLRLIGERDEIRVVADQHGAPTWSRTIAGMTSLALARGVRGVVDLDWWRQHSGIYHLTAAGETSWAGFAGAIADLAPLPRKALVIPITTAEYPTPARRPANSRLAMGKLESTFGIAAPDWHAALGRCLADKFV